MGAMAGTAEQDVGRIVESAAEGDEVAFGRIVAAYQEQMYCICVVVCRDRSLAEEAVQSAWSSIWQRLDSLREPEKLRPWVVAVAVNEAKSLLRKRRRHSEHEVPVDTSDKPGGIDPATGVAGIDLRDVMRRLDPDDRALLTMRYVLGFDATELSTAVGLSPSGTRTRLERLLERLRRELE
jgi:RNA polymerase sigma factor (sigma-70 family)